MKTYSHAELGELARRAAAGDRTAFDRLYAATARFQYYRILQMVGSAQVAEDLLQQTYLHLWQKIAEIDPPELVAAYLSGIKMCIRDSTWRAPPCPGSPAARRHRPASGPCRRRRRC